MGIPLVGVADVRRWEELPFQPWNCQGVLSAINSNRIKISGSDWAPGSASRLLKHHSPSYYREMYNVLEFVTRPVYV